ncbi:MAG TPA: hypothetical protein P5057_07185 [Acidobacteriota bacterium]|nr:hypothetical protein [Acidobacteriota bacterium]
MPGYLFSRIMLIPAVVFFAVGPSRVASLQIEEFRRRNLRLPFGRLRH